MFNPMLENGAQGGDLRRGRFRVRFAQNAQDLDRAQALRHRCFFPHLTQDPMARDSDRFDAQCRHLLVEDVGGAILATVRLQLFTDGSGVQRGYAGQSYDLRALTRCAVPMLELGRFCLVAPGDSGDVLRLIWAAIARYVDENKVEILFGCSSFAGLEPQAHAPAWGYLRAHHLAPAGLAPRQRSVETLRLRDFAGQGGDPRLALASLPPLLRSYLAMGGWVSDHAVIDRHMRTIHVFTGLEVAKVPPARARALRQIAIASAI